MFFRLVKQSVTEAIVWLAVVVFAVPMLPAFACECPSNTTITAFCGGGQHDRNRLVAGHRCCTDRFASSPSACYKSALTVIPQSNGSQSNGCSCGDSCSCHAQQRCSQPGESLVPERNLASRLISTDTDSCLTTTVAAPTNRLPSSSIVKPLALISSLQRCILLSRFTL